MTGRQQIGRAPEQPARCADVGAARRPAARLGETASCTLAECANLLVDRADLDSVAVTLLQVVAEDLLVLEHPRARRSLEPVGEPLVQVGAERLGRPAVGGVPNEDVLEAKGVLAGELRLGGPHEIPARQGIEARRH